jgi:hypothetical protein
MQFLTKQESFAAAIAISDELRPQILFAGKIIPCHITGGKCVGRRKLPWTFFDRLTCAACLVPPGTRISVFSALTQTGLDGLNWLREYYRTVDVRKRPGDGADSLQGVPQKASTRRRAATAGTNHKK